MNYGRYSGTTMTVICVTFEVSVLLSVVLVSSNPLKKDVPPPRRGVGYANAKDHSVLPRSAQENVTFFPSWGQPWNEDTSIEKYFQYQVEGRRAKHIPPNTSDPSTTKQILRSKGHSKDKLHEEELAAALSYVGTISLHEKGRTRSSSLSRSREFSFAGFVDSIYTLVTSGIGVIVSNIVGSESKSAKSRSNRVNYKGHQLLRITPYTDAQVAELLDLRDSGAEGISFWTAPAKNRTTDVVLPPKMISEVKSLLKDQQFDFKVLIPDLQKVIANQNPKMSKMKREGLVTNKAHKMTWKRYHRYADIIRYLEYLASTYSHLVELVTIGHSHEGQPLKLVKVSTGPKNKTKPTIWIDGGMHAREWIGPAVATYILSQLVEKNSTYTKLLETSDWMILPVVNPDGYEFSHTGDRLWRKTRSNRAEEEQEDEARFSPMGLFHLISHYTRWFWTRCDGVDPNRNFGFHWGEEIGDGFSSDPCHETYAGPHAFSEPETRAMANYILANRENIRMYLTLHAYSQMWLVPWGYTRTRPSDYTDLTDMARKATNAIAKVHGTQYQVGASPDLLYPTAGGSDDWAKGAAGIKYAYTVELRDRGKYGFLLPSTQIVPTARETWAGIRAIARLVTSNT